MRPIDPARLPLDDEHPQLASATRAAIALVGSLRESLQPVEGASFWMQHGEFADRAWHLAGHLESALDDAGRARYASAFGTLRTAMEHELTDRLLLHAERYYEVVEGLSKEEFADVEARAASMSDIAAVERWGSGARLTRIGHDVVDEEGQVVEKVSPYWHVMKDHNATIGPPKFQAMFATGIIDVEQLEKHAQRNATLHSRYLKWEAILRNLVLNDLIGQDHWHQLEVHYRWLSAFTHATQTGYDLIERECGHPSWGVRARSHLLGELVLLYAATFAANELQWFCEFVDKRSHMIELSTRAVADTSIAHVQELTGYFWWPGSSPTDFDRVTEANHRAWKACQVDKGDGWPSPPDPKSLADADIGYYDDPYDRLKRMHEGFVEMTTGLGYSPPW